MTAIETGQRFGNGPLARAAALVHTLLVVQVLFLATGAAGLIPLVLLDRDVSNLPLVALCAVPVGPALSAAVYALRHRSTDLTDLTPARQFLRGYRMNAAGVLKLWVPWLAWETVLGVNLAHGWWPVPVVTLAVLAALWQANALVIASLYEFRARDTARLAGYFLLRRLVQTLGVAGLAVAAVAVVLFWSEAVLTLAAAGFAAALLRTCRPMRTEIEERFVR
ncbi:hypothetical protein [Paractinoplanes rishiriensis]|uniref:Uncharacterized protein n=1 Tax=Paractinoplanes rishiriensis TaxID=1050105 RepID=A0A919MUS2_9ACTN|nr:hypothetical protein [Actinoplanes rishiriensis]GIE95649.1 hypothetical protein Ari01nite_31140 [Actinoplanes rishiriensis]